GAKRTLLTESRQPTATLTLDGMRRQNEHARSYRLTLTTTANFFRQGDRPPGGGQKYNRYYRDGDAPMRLRIGSVWQPPGSIQTSREVAADQFGLTPANLMTPPHLSISSAMSLPKPAGESARGVPLSSASRALNV